MPITEAPDFVVRHRRVQEWLQSRPVVARVRRHERGQWMTYVQGGRVKFHGSHAIAVAAAHWDAQAFLRRRAEEEPPHA